MRVVASASRWFPVVSRAHCYCDLQSRCGVRIMSRHVMHLVSCRVAACHVMACLAVSRCVVLCLVALCPVMLVSGRGTSYERTAQIHAAHPHTAHTDTTNTPTAHTYATHFHTTHSLTTHLTRSRSVILHLRLPVFRLPTCVFQLNLRCVIRSYYLLKHVKFK